jgi:hypothetical protein
MACRICETRRPRRFCPGVRGDICSVCCGTEREVSVDCPLDCEYLIEAHQHERIPQVDEAALPDRDIRLTDAFLQEHEQLITYFAVKIAETAGRVPGITDFDAREALAAAVRTFRTRQSGLYYDTRPANPMAAGLYDAMLEAIEEYRKYEQQKFGMARTRDAEFLGALVFLERIEFTRNNGRKRGRAFLGSLAGQIEQPQDPAPAAPSLIVP